MPEAGREAPPEVGREKEGVTTSSPYEAIVGAADGKKVTFTYSEHYGSTVIFEPNGTVTIKDQDVPVYEHKMGDEGSAMDGYVTQMREAIEMVKKAELAVPVGNVERFGGMVRIAQDVMDASTVKNYIEKDSEEMEGFLTIWNQLSADSNTANQLKEGVNAYLAKKEYKLALRLRDYIVEKKISPLIRNMFRVEGSPKMDTDDFFKVQYPKIAKKDISVFLDLFERETSDLIKQKVRQDLLSIEKDGGDSAPKEKEIKALRLVWRNYVGLVCDALVKERQQDLINAERNLISANNELNYLKERRDGNERDDEDLEVEIEDLEVEIKDLETEIKEFETSIARRRSMDDTEFARLIKAEAKFLISGRPLVTIDTADPYEAIVGAADGKKVTFTYSEHYGSTVIFEPNGTVTIKDQDVPVYEHKMGDEGSAMDGYVTQMREAIEMVKKAELAVPVGNVERFGGMVRIAQCIMDASSVHIYIKGYEKMNSVEQEDFRKAMTDKSK